MRLKIIANLWIMTKDGILLFEKTKNLKEDPLLVKTLMIALNSLAKELGNGEVSRFETNKRRFIFLKKSNITFISSTSSKVKEKKIKQELEAIAEVFFMTHPKEIFENWDLDASMFSNFDKVLKDSLRNNFNEFQKAFM